MKTLAAGLVALVLVGCGGGSEDGEVGRGLRVVKDGEAIVEGETVGACAGESFAVSFDAQGADAIEGVWTLPGNGTQTWTVDMRGSTGWASWVGSWDEPGLYAGEAAAIRSGQVVAETFWWVEATDCAPESNLPIRGSARAARSGL